jgi:predicted negative regulator of RcsB-dependent stress response
MAEKDVSKPAEPPKPVHIGGESLLDRLRPYLKHIIVGCIAVIVVVFVVVTVNWLKERKQVAATAKLEQILEVAREPVHAKDDKPDAKDAKPPGFTSVKERGAAVLDAIAKQGTDVAGHAFRGGQLLDAGKPDEAITEYRAGVADKALDGLLCREGLGLALEAKASAEKDPAARQKGLEEALAAFVAMQPDEAGPRRAYALYHQGRIQQLLGKRPDAKALFEKAKQATKDDRELTELLDKRLAALGAA